MVIFAASSIAEDSNSTFITAYVIKSNTPEYSSSQKIIKRHGIGYKVTVVAKEEDWCKLSNGHFIKASNLSEDPVSYFRKKYNDDIVFVSISMQKVIYYKHGKVIANSNCVTGNASSSPTPKGLFTVLHKKTDANLMGLEKYHVDYYISITDKIGLHDAPWRNQFGGSIYKRNGSHGCVNLPLNAIKKIYESCREGTRVLIF